MYGEQARTKAGGEWKKKKKQQKKKKTSEIRRNGTWRNVRQNAYHTAVLARSERAIFTASGPVMRSTGRGGLASGSSLPLVQRRHAGTPGAWRQSRGKPRATSSRATSKKVNDTVSVSFSVFFPSPCCHHTPMASVFLAFPQLRTAAPRLSRRLFVYGPCLNSQARVAASPSASAAPFSLPRPSLSQSQSQSVRWKSTHPLRSSVAVNASHAPNAALAEAAVKAEGRSSSFPKTTSKSVAYWLLGSAASVFGIVVFGGLTRLTESG
jgi:hypothetical protein